MATGKALKEGGELVGEIATEITKRIKKEISDRANQGDELAKKMINAWHGSPHDFPAERLVQFPDGRKEFIVGIPNTLPNVPEGAKVLKDFPLGRMRMDKLGTGEGAQAYGHGLYTADARDVAEGYKEGLSRQDYLTHGGKRYEVIKDDDNVYEVVENTYNMAGGFDRGYESGARNIDKKFKTPQEAEQWVRREKGLSDNYEFVPSEDGIEYGGEFVNKGSLYNVNIDATPDELLDWDKPLSEQPEGIRNALSDIQEFTGSKRELGDVSGEGVYRSMRSSTGDDYERITKHLQDKGIKGIQYSDAMSRGAEGGTKNYVIFDENIISIAKKYGIPVTLATSVAAGSMTPQQAMAEQAKQEYLQKSGLMGTVQGVNSPVLSTLADYIDMADRATAQSPANLLVPTALAEWARKGSYGEADLGDAFWAAFDIAP